MRQLTTMSGSSGPRCTVNHHAVNYHAGNEKQGMGEGGASFASGKEKGMNGRGAFRFLARAVLHPQRTRLLVLNIPHPSVRACHARAVERVVVHAAKGQHVSV